MVADFTWFATVLGVWYQNICYTHGTDIFKRTDPQKIFVLDFAGFEISIICVDIKPYLIREFTQETN
jgi:hypothetical protein